MLKRLIPSAWRWSKQGPVPLWRRLIVATSIAASLGFVLLVAGFIVVRPAPPNLGAVWERRAEPSIVILDKDDQLVMTRGAREFPIVPLAELPPYLWKAFLAIEDRRFYEHGPIDPRGIFRAFWVNVDAGAFVQGGSTITQQLAKNLFLTPERSLIRKAQEVVIAFWLERHLSKDAILTLYLNRVYLGAGNYGVEAASRFYFGKSARAVTLAEAAMLAGLPKAPSRYAPTTDLARARKRADTVLDSLLDAELADEKDVFAARVMAARIKETEARDAANYYVDWIMDEMWRIAEAEDAAAWRNQNLIIHTTYDPKLQIKAELAVMNALDDAAEARKAEQAALVALDPGGAVRALVGGRSYAESQFNRATQAMRQPGSAFKPFVYLTALEMGLEPRSVILDAPVAVDGWTPANASGTYAGQVTLAGALKRSLNTATVRLSETVGRARVIETAHRLGIRSPIEPNPSLALGTSEVTLLELAGAYLPFLNDGFPHPPYGLRMIETEDGTVLYQHTDHGFGRVVASRYAAVMNGMLNGVIEDGTGRAARLYNRKAAGKTGTSQDYRDAWFIGYTPQLLTGVWIGNDDSSPMVRVGGGTLPARLWRDFMERALYGAPVVAMAGVDTVYTDMPAAAISNERRRSSPTGPSWLPWNWFD